MNEFLQWAAMGGYYTYIWPAYALVGVVLALNALSIKWQRHSVYKKLQQWFKR